MTKFRGWILACALFMLLPKLSAQFVYFTNNSEVTLDSYTGTNSAVTVSNFVTDIAADAFETANAARYMTTLTIPISVTNIGVEAFASCTNLSTVTLGNGVITLGEDAFQYCRELASINFPATLTNLGNTVFYEDTNLLSITVTLDNPAFSSAGGILYDAAQHTIVQYPGGLAGSYAIPATVNTISNAAMWNCVGLTSVSLPVGLTNTGYGPFSGCVRLTNITVVAGNLAVCTVSNVLFDAAQQNIIQYPAGVAGSYTIPSSVTGIGITAFSFCNGLTNLIIPASVQNIGESAFEECVNLTNVLFEGNLPTNLGSYTFLGDNNTTFYDLSGATGFYGVVSTVLWNPTFAAVQANPAAFTITGTEGIPIVLQATTNLASGPWTTLQAYSLTNGSINLTDFASSGYSTRFYRICFPN